MKYPLFCSKCLRVFSAAGPRNVHQTQCLRNLNIKRKEARVVLQRIALPPDMFIPSNTEEEEEVDVVDVSEDENKENDGGNTKEAKVKGEEQQ